MSTKSPEGEKKMFRKISVADRSSGVAQKVSVKNSSKKEKGTILQETAHPKKRILLDSMKRQEDSQKKKD